MHALASTTKPLLVRCPAPDCQTDHETYAVEDIVLIANAGNGLMTNEEAEAEAGETYQETLDRKLALRGKTYTFPTVLGLWFGNINEN